METNMNELKTLQEEEKSSIVGGIVMVCGNVYNENKKEITKEVGDYILYVVEQERQKSNTLGMMKGVESNINIGDKVTYSTYDDEYVVVGLSQMIYDEDCAGEPEWKITNEIQEVAIAKYYPETSYQKPSWVSIKDVYKLKQELK